MKKSLALLTLVFLLPILSISGMAYPIQANPLFLAVYPPYSVINVVNTTYIGATQYFNNNVTQIIMFVAHNSSIKVELINATTGLMVACIYAWIPTSLYNYVYYSPQLGSALFVVNVSSSNSTYTVPVGYLHLGIDYVKTINGTTVYNVQEIPLGQLCTYYNGQFVKVWQLPTFQKYLNGENEILQDIKEDLEGVYVLTFVS
jgi:hypothetical protein